MCTWLRTYHLTYNKYDTEKWRKGGLFQGHLDSHMEADKNWAPTFHNFKKSISDELLIYQRQNNSISKI